MSIRPEQKEQVRQATDLVRLVGEHVKLTPKGREFVGCCAFHDDKSPSMYVVPHKQMYHCFVCGASGDAIGWMINYHKMAFPEAVRFLADRAGIVLQEDDDPRARQAAREATDERKAIQQANEQAQSFFQKALTSPQAESIRQYIQERGISDEMVEAFGLGYAPDDWTQLAQHARRQNWSLKGLQAAHLVRKRQDGSPYDFFRHRLMFPVLDALSRPIAFGGRKLREEDNPKYINSPEHRLFNKSATLYGIHRAKKPIMDSRTAVIVEGYTDVIACHQAGAENAVATLGTALTQQHIRELRKYADQIILVFDGDAAGQKAADRALELFLSESLDVKLCVLPGGKDPADFLEEAGIDGWNQAMADAQDALSYQFQSIKTQLDEANTLTAKQRLLDNYIDTLLSMGMTRTGPFRTAFFVKRLNELSGVSESELAELIRTREQNLTPGRAPAPGRSNSSAPGGRTDGGTSEGNNRGGGFSTGTPNTPSRRATPAQGRNASSNTPGNDRPANQPGNRKHNAPKQNNAPSSQQPTAQPSAPSNWDDGDHAPLDSSVYDGNFDPSLTGDYDPAFDHEPSLPDDYASGDFDSLPSQPSGNPSHSNNQSNQNHQAPNNAHAAAPQPASAPRRSLQRAGRLAELQLLGGLIQDNHLFDLPMADGVPIEEALPAEAMPTVEGQALFSRITDAIIAGQPVRLASLLGDLAEAGKHDLIRLATEADAFIENACEGNADRIKNMVQQAAEAIRRIADENDPTLRPNQPGQDPIDKAKQLQALMAERRLAPNPGRIGRTRNRL